MKTNILTMIKQAIVVWRPLGEVAEIYGGLTGKTKNDFENGNAKYITYKNIFGNIEVEPNNLETVKVSDNERQHQVKYGDILFTGSSEIAEEAGMSSSVTTRFDEPIYLNSFSFGVRFNQNIEITPEFSKYLFRSHYMRKQIIKTASGVTRFNISKEKFKKIQIPIPPLELQKEIVKILDILTELNTDLTTTLETEHILRKKQYQYYRDFLLSESELAKVGFEWKSLGEVTLPTQNIKWKNQDDLFKYIDLTSVDLQTHAITQTTDIGADMAPSRAQKLVATDDVIFATTRPTQMRLTIIPKEFNGQIASTGYCVLRADKSQILPKWIYFSLSANTFKVYLEENQSGSAYPAISDSKVKDFKIPIPSLETQAKIVAILDKFDRLTSSITDGLPKEIELRRKQYEYYRALLLGFARV